MDRDIEQRFDHDDEFERVQIVDADTDEVLMEQAILRDIDQMALGAAIFEQLELDPDDVEEGMEVGLKDIRRELGESMSGRFRVDDDEDLT